MYKEYLYFESVRVKHTLNEKTNPKNLSAFFQHLKKAPQVSGLSSSTSGNTEDGVLILIFNSAPTKSWLI